MKYLPHVDGLRTLAVLSVVLFHLDGALLPGGFVGVDVFFVISGFLISSLILRELEEGTFTFDGFYLRRVRRILPALFVTIAAAVLFGAVFLSPDRLTTLGASAAAATLSVSNIYFWLTAGYFDAEAATKPLLHTWSLSVEEQFYLVWPALLLLLARSRILLIGAIVIMFAASLAASYLTTPHWPDAAFYLTPFRMFEFALGMACIFLRKAPSPRLFATLLTFAGFALIGYSLYAFSGETPIPGVAAFIPCLGAALLIAFADRSTLLGPVLANPVSVYIGKISYSIYLVHWPILVFYWYLKFGPLSIADKLIAAGLIAAAALLLYYLIERPFHRQLFRTRPALMVGAAVAAAILLSVTAASMWRGEGWPGRFSTQTQQLVDFHVSQSAWRRRPECFIGRDDAIERLDRAVCLTRDAQKIDVLLVGDSHSGRMRPGLDAAFPEINLMQAGTASCVAARGYKNRRSRPCEAINELVFDEIIPNRGADYVVLSTNWLERDLPRLQRTLDYLQQFDVRVVVFGPVPTFREPLPEILFRGRAAPDLEQYVAQFLDPNRRMIDAEARAMTEAHGFAYLDFMDVICPREDVCQPLTSAGAPILADKGHLTPAASIELLTAARAEGRLAFPPPASDQSALQASTVRTTAPD